MSIERIIFEILTLVFGLYHQNQNKPLSMKLQPHKAYRVLILNVPID